jgi:hypothetical protein
MGFVELRKGKAEQVAQRIRTHSAFTRRIFRGIENRRE